MKNITDYLNKQEIQNVKRRFNHLANYKYGDTTDVNECEESLFLVLDADDEINTVFNEEKRYILEYEIYKKFPPTKCVYRLDRSNNTTGQQTHIHVYADKKRHHQLYAINIDGSSHDGSKYLLSPKHQDALRAIGFIVPKDGLLEWCDLGACRLILGQISLIQSLNTISNGDVLAYGDSWSREILPNVHYHQNKVVRIDNVDFILSTLWSHIRPEDEYFVHRGMNDFRQILYNGRRFTPADFNTEHEKCLDFIKRSVAESTAERVVVVTHHLPTMAVVAPEHKGNLLNSAFATELGDFISDSRIDAWIFGHSHANIDAAIGNTRIVCNQLGYVYYR